MIEENKKEYSADSISELVGLECIRERPDMYIGTTSGMNPDGLFRIVREVIDNSLDEYLGKFNKELYVFYNTKTYEITVIDNGRGIPTEINSKSGISSMTMVFTKLHAGGKFNKDSYKVSSGKNGVGIKATNALSEYLQVWSNNNTGNKWITQKFKRGNINTEVEQVKLPDEYKPYIKKTGTIIKFKPDSLIFKQNIKLNVYRLKKELNDIQYLCPFLNIHFIVDNEEHLYYSEEGLVELVKNETSRAPSFSFNNDSMDVALNWTKEEGIELRSFVNISYTNLGGTHLNGLKKAIINVIRDNSKMKILPDDILEGLIGAIHYRMAEPQYQGQTKNELTNIEAEKDVIDTLTPALQKYFRKNSELLDYIIKYSEKMFSEKEKMKASKDLLKGLNKLNTGAKYISDKFLDADRRKYKDVKDLELFIVEGDSAGGHFKKGREDYQAVLKLRGKVINAEKCSAEDLFGKTNFKKGEKKKEGNREIKDLVAALGCGVLDQYDESKLRFNKLFLLTDADVDGQHIQNLILAFLINYMPDLIKNGHVYAIDTPLFIASSAKHRFYGKTRLDVESQMVKVKEKTYTVLRCKGLGEMNVEQLSTFCLNPKSRKLIKLEWNDNTIDMLHKTMGNDVAFRKELLGIA